MKGFDCLIVRTQIELIESRIDSMRTFLLSLEEADKRTMAGLSHATQDYLRQLTYAKLMLDLENEETPHHAI